MVRHFFLDKTNSIIEGSSQNIGLNPVLYIGYGKSLMRGLIHFDTCQIASLIDDKTFADTSKLTFNLKMTNFFSIDGIPYEKKFIDGVDGFMRRAASYDLMLVKLPCDFDQGRGFDFVSDFWVHDGKSYSTHGSNWFYAKDGVTWKSEYDKLDFDDFGDHQKIKTFNRVGFDKMAKEIINIAKQYFEENYDEEKCKTIEDELAKIYYYDQYNNKSLWGGIYPQEVFVEEYNKYLKGEDSIIVGTQHFDFGCENLCIDITDYVLNAIETGENYGLCLCFTPNLEDLKTEYEQFASFVTDHTNTFFHPYVEAIYNEVVNDDRGNFIIGKNHNLYLYVNDNGPKNLDNTPKCSIDNVEFPVKQVTKGVYCAEISASALTMEPGTMYYDKWSEIAIDGEAFDDVEMEFSVKPKSMGVKMNSNAEIRENLIPSLYGINDNENLNIGEVREVGVDFLVKYEREKKELIDSAEYRIYVMDGNREYEVIPYTKIEKAFTYNYFIVYTGDLIPNDYFVDIKYQLGREIKFAKKALKFRVVSNVTERYE